jgi:hypothetical protein
MDKSDKRMEEFKQQMEERMEVNSKEQMNSSKVQME